jgi:hypothetical protein
MELLGIIASIATIISGLGWVLDRNSRKFDAMQKRGTDVITKLSEKVENLDKTLVDVRLALPEKYVSKEELMVHIQGEERWHQSIDRRLEDIRGELSSLREWRHR